MTHVTSRTRLSAALQDAMDSLMRNENRFTSLQRSAPEYAAMLQSAMKEEFFARHEARKRKAMADEDLLEYLKPLRGLWRYNDDIMRMVRCRDHVSILRVNAHENDAPCA